MEPIFHCVLIGQVAMVNKNMRQNYVEKKELIKREEKVKCDTMKRDTFKIMLRARRQTIEMEIF